MLREKCDYEGRAGLHRACDDPLVRSEPRRGFFSLFHVILNSHKAAAPCGYFISRTNFSLDGSQL